MTLNPNRDFLTSLSQVATKLGTAMLRRLPAETAHSAGMWLLRSRTLNVLPLPCSQVVSPRLAVSVPGIGQLKHPIGLAAGFDKNCHAPQGFADLGFAMIEVGTVTPFGQPGNPRPRLFRQSPQRAIINRMGFNNDGTKVVASRLRELNWDHERAPLGINLGKNKHTPQSKAVDDYVEGYRAFAGLCRYYVVNISSPNTPGLRDLASQEFISDLASAFSGVEKGVWIKLDPDMERRHFQSLVETIADKGYPGIILTNTHRVDWPQAGGQSGHPVAIGSTRCLEWAWEVHRGQLPMIGCGGILSGSDILEKVIRGASAVQIYTALVYRGPWVVQQLLTELEAELTLRGFENLEDAFGSYYDSRVH